MCGGDESRCDFYSYKRKQSCKHADREGYEDNMLTAEMWISAQTDGKTYITEDMRYSKAKGFHDKYGLKWKPESFTTIEQIMQCKWAVCNTMTKAEAERKYGIIIED